MQVDPSNYYLTLAAAFARGRCALGEPLNLPDELQNGLLEDLSTEELATVFQVGLEAGLKLHKFKRTGGLPRVRRVFGVLQSLSPSGLLDVGSGRGVFLWPLLDQFPGLPVTVIDHDPIRARDLEAVHLGGVERLTVREMDATQLQFADNSFDVTTLLEVLEHIPNVERAISEAVRVSRRFVVLSVPSKPDDNPEHIHLLNEPRLREVFAAAGVPRLNCDYVLGHLVAVANLRDKPC